MELDLVFGVVLVCGVMCTQLGLAMGSGLSAGAATLFAAWREGKFLRSMSVIPRMVFEQRTLALRWMDDRWILVRV